MKTVRFIGDVHGKFDRYKKLIKDVDSSRQVGDFGVGFFYPSGIPMTNPPHDSIMKGDHKYIRGNHDNPKVSAQQKYWIRDGSIEMIEGVKVMYVGGAFSVDKEWRTEGLDWWEDEELPYKELYELIDLYASEKPDVLVTHDGTNEITEVIEQVSRRRKLQFGSRTRDALSSMYTYHRPKLHIFGHWHYDLDYVENGTRHVCLAELSHMDVSFNKGMVVPLKE